VDSKKVKMVVKDLLSADNQRSLSFATPMVAILTRFW